MTWGPFTSEAINLDAKLRKLHKDGRMTDAIVAIEEAFEEAWRIGPSEISYEQFERQNDASHAP